MHKSCQWDEKKNGWTQIKVVLYQICKLTRFISVCFFFHLLFSIVIVFFYSFIVYYLRKTFFFFLTCNRRSPSLNSPEVWMPARKKNGTKANECEWINLTKSMVANRTHSLFIQNAISLNRSVDGQKQKTKKNCLSTICRAIDQI